MTHYDITIGNDIAMDVHCDVIMSLDVIMGAYHDVTMHTDVAMDSHLLWGLAKHFRITDEVQPNIPESLMKYSQT